MTELMNKKIEQGREYRALDLAPTPQAEMTVEGYATTFNEPYTLYRFEDERGMHEVREIVEPTAFNKTDMSDVIFQYDHEGRVFARLSNGTMSLDVDEHGLHVTAHLGGTEIGRNLFEEIKGGYTNKMSFGFTVEDDRFEIDGNNYLRTITNVGKLYDVSAVSIPANGMTEISARKHCEGVIAELETERMAAEERERIAQEKRESLARRVESLRKESHGN